MHTEATNQISTANFYGDLCDAFVVANIPLLKLENPIVNAKLVSKIIDESLNDVFLQLICSNLVDY